MNFFKSDYSHRMLVALPLPLSLSLSGSRLGRAITLLPSATLLRVVYQFFTSSPL